MSHDMGTAIPFEIELAEGVVSDGVVQTSEALNEFQKIYSFTKNLDFLRFFVKSGIFTISPLQQTS